MKKEFQEPVVEFVSIDLTEDVVTTSPGSSQYMCQGSNPDEECPDANRF